MRCATDVSLCDGVVLFEAAIPKSWGQVGAAYCNRVAVWCSAAAEVVLGVYYTVVWLIYRYTYRGWF